MALIWANSPFQELYQTLFSAPISLHVFHRIFVTSLMHIINDGLMCFFFLLVTLEVKNELLLGELNSIGKALLPVIAATGGMLIPAAIFTLFNHHHYLAMRGWAIPTATDIAFSLAILIMLRSMLPRALKGLLTALAIIDDIGAIIIIAIFYSTEIHVHALLAACLLIVVLIILNLCGVKKITPYLAVGFILWLSIMKSGIHPTIAGVVIGFCIPLKTESSPLKRLEHRLNPWVAYCVLPLFALANTGLTFSHFSLNSLIHPITLGIFLGLVVGKQLGVFGFSWLAVRTKLVKLPSAISFSHLYGMSVLCGIGFTMSLFIGDLAYKTIVGDYIQLAKLGVLSASAVSGVLGSFWLWGASKSK